MEKLKLYRRRFIPDEIVFLKNDEIISADKNVIVTKWNVLKKRDDFSHGVSCYFLNDNFKISKFIDKDENLLYWYCDIIDWEFLSSENSYIFNDLLIDVIIYPNGFVKVVDLGEISQALDKKLIDESLAKKALSVTDKLLDIVYSGKFEKYKAYIENLK